MRLIYSLGGVCSIALCVNLLLSLCVTGADAAADPEAGSSRLTKLFRSVVPRNYVHLEIQFANNIVRDPVESYAASSVLKGWTTIVVSADEIKRSETVGGICALLKADGNIPLTVDLVTLVGDYADLNVFTELLTCYSPRALSFLFNPHFQPLRSAVTTSPACRANQKGPVGASIGAFERIAHERQYDLIDVELCGYAVISRRYDEKIAEMAAMGNPFASRIDPNSQPGKCAQYEFYSSDVLNACLVSIAADAASGDYTRNASIVLYFNFAEGAVGGVPTVSTFQWSHAAFAPAAQSLPPGDDPLVDFIGIAHSLAGSIRAFIAPMRFQHSIYWVNIHSTIIAEAKRKYPALFNGFDGYGGDLSGAFAVSARESGSDKFNPHGYYRFYSRYIQQYQHLLQNQQRKFGLLEIGIQGGHSVKMWQSIFPSNVFIYGLDNQNSFVGDQYLVFKADQSIQEHMTYVNKYIHASEYNEVFLVVDDGSHHPQHQIGSFNYFFSELLLLGGTYIIEDIETSYWRQGHILVRDFEFGYKHAQSAIEIFKHLVDDVNYEFLADDDRLVQDALLNGLFSEKTRRLISSISFGHNCIIIVKKSAEEVLVYNDRMYRARHWSKDGHKPFAGGSEL